MKNFLFQRASDVVRDGLGIELVDADSYETIAEVFRCDKDNTLVFSSFVDDELPFSMVQQLLEIALQQLEPFEDGSPLSTATNHRRNPSRDRAFGGSF